MTVVKTVATHEIVQSAFPRPVTEKDELGMATGKAIDAALSQYSHEFSQSRRPTAASMNRLAAGVLDEELSDADLPLSATEREKVLAGVAGVLQAFRRSEVFGLSRPRSRLILVNEQVGVYAQPDYWNGKDRFYEMKSYHATPMPPDVRLQLSMFQLAFPKFHAFLACFNRHSLPVETTIEEIPALEPAEVETLLRLALSTGLELGREKVLEYMDSPTVRYTIAAPPLLEPGPQRSVGGKPLA
jgi:hypothetical protein